MGGILVKKNLYLDKITVTTDCVVNELQNLGGSLYGAFVIAKRFKSRNCGHQDQHVSATECVTHLVGMLKVG